MSNARANAAVYDQRRRKLKKRNKRYFQRINDYTDRILCDLFNIEDVAEK